MNWKAVAELGGTLAIYMPGGHEGELAGQLVAAGLAADTPCFVVANASRKDEQVVETTIGELPGVPKLPAPALLLIGAVAGPSGQASTRQVGSAQKVNKTGGSH